MMSIDIKSVLIGVLGTLLIFISIGATKQNDNLGDITVNSITILDNGEGGFIRTLNKDGKITSYLGTDKGGNGQLGLHNDHGNKMVLMQTMSESGSLLTFNSDGKQTTYLGTVDDGKGILETRNSNGIKTTIIGTLKGENGYLGIHNKFGIEIVYLGSDTNQDGLIQLKDHSGINRWEANGKK